MPVPVNQVKGMNEKCESVLNTAKSYGKYSYSSIGEGSGGGSLNGNSGSGGHGGGIIDIEAIHL